MNQAEQFHLSPPRHAVVRVAHESRQCLLTVVDVQGLTPHMLRVRFHAPELHGLVSLSPDDHVKIFVPDASAPEGVCRRDYTIRYVDDTAGLLTIDFALHEAGPATLWATRAQVGETLKIAGPRKSVVVNDDFDWVLLVGDATALPAIGRRLEELRPGVPVTTIIEITSDADRLHFRTQADWTAVWLVRDPVTCGDTLPLLTALDSLILPSGDGYVWIAAEAQAARALRDHMVAVRGHPKEWLKASSYWDRSSTC